MGSRIDGTTERPRAVGEYLIERLVAGGASKLCFVIGPGKSDILTYFGSEVCGVPACYTVQPRPAGLCDAVFRAAPFIGRDEPVAVGLPDTIWFPEDALAALPAGGLSFLLFPVAEPSLFDVVVTGAAGEVLEVQTKPAAQRSRWIWGAFKMSGAVFHDLFALWRSRGAADEYFGPLVNAYLEAGGQAVGVQRGEAYVDVGTLDGYRQALQLLTGRHERRPGATGRCM